MSYGLAEVFFDSSDLEHGLRSVVTATFYL